MFGGVFPANAPPSENITLVAELVMGAALLFGARLARRGQYRLHAWCQSCVVVLNLVVISFAMAASFGERVLPKIPERLGRPFYALATTHGAVGSIAELAGIYVLIAAGRSGCRGAGS